MQPEVITQKVVGEMSKRGKGTLFLGIYLQLRWLYMLVLRVRCSCDQPRCLASRLRILGTGVVSHEQSFYFSLVLPCTQATNEGCVLERPFVQVWICTSLKIMQIHHPKR